MRKLLVSFATGMALILPTVSAAVGLGGIKVYTKLNQKLNAEIPILSVSNKNRKTLSVTMGSNADFARRGLEKTAAVRKVKLNIVTKGGRSYVKVSSQQLINVPYLNFIVNLNSEEGIVSREYAVFLDPVGGVKSKMSSKPAAKGVQRPKAGVKVNSKKKLARSSGANPAVSSYRGGKYGPIRRGETLWSIAKHVRPSENVSVRSMVNAIIRANPRVFPNRRASEMPSGVTLHIPTMKGYSPYSGGYAPIPNKALAQNQSQKKVVRPKSKTRPVSKTSKPVEKTVKKSEAAVKPPVSKVENKGSDASNTADSNELESNENSSAMQDVKNAVSEVVEDTAKGISDTAQNASNAVSEGVSNLGDGASDAADSLKETTGSAIDAVKEGSKDAVNSVKEAGSDLAEGAKKAVDNVAEVMTPKKVETPEVKLTEPELVVKETEVKVDLPKAEAPKVAVNTPKVKVNTPRINTPSVATSSTSEDTLIPGVPDVATYIGGGLGALGLLGGGLLLSRRNKSSDLGKGVVLTDERDIEEFNADDEVLFDDEDVLTDDDDVLIADESSTQVDDDLNDSFDDKLDQDDGFDDDVVETSVDDLIVDTSSDEDDEFDLDALDFDTDFDDDVADIKDELTEDIDNGLDFNLGEEDDLFTDEKPDSNEALVIDDDDFVFDLDDMSNDKDGVLSEKEDELDFTTSDDLDGLEDLSLDIDDPDSSTDKVVDDDFSFDLTDESDELPEISLDDELLDGELNVSDDLDIDFSEDFEADTADLAEVSEAAEDIGDELSLDLDDGLDFIEVDEDDFDFEDTADLNSIDTKLDSVLDGDVDLADDDFDLDSIDADSELENLLADADDPIDLRPQLDVDSPDLSDDSAKDTDWNDDTMISFEEETKAIADDIDEVSSDVESSIVSAINPSKAQMKLDLAGSFISIGETSRASDLLQEVLEIGEEAQVAEAKSMLDGIS